MEPLNTVSGRRSSKRSGHNTTAEPSTEGNVWSGCSSAQCCANLHKDTSWTHSTKTSCSLHTTDVLAHAWLMMLATKIVLVLFEPCATHARHGQKAPTTPECVLRSQHPNSNAPCTTYSAKSTIEEDTNRVLNFVCTNLWVHLQAQLCSYTSPLRSPTPTQMMCHSRKPTPHSHPTSAPP